MALRYLLGRSSGDLLSRLGRPRSPFPASAAACSASSFARGGGVASNSLLGLGRRMSTGSGYGPVGSSLSTAEGRILGRWNFTEDDRMFKESWVINCMFYVFIYYFIIHYQYARSLQEDNISFLQKQLLAVAKREEALKKQLSVRPS